MKKRTGQSLESFQYWDSVKGEWEHTKSAVRVKAGDQLYLACENLVLTEDPVKAALHRKRARSQSLDTSASGSPSKTSKTSLHLSLYVLISFNFIKPSDHRLQY